MPFHPLIPLRGTYQTETRPYVPQNLTAGTSTADVLITVQNRRQPTRPAAAAAIRGDAVMQPDVPRASTTSIDYNGTDLPCVMWSKRVEMGAHAV